MQDEFVEPLESFLARAITELQIAEAPASSVMEVLETLSAYESYQQLSENAPRYPQLGKFQEKKTELLKKLPELNDAEIKTLTLDLVRELKTAVVERYYPPLEHVSPGDFPDANLTLATVKANAQHTRHALETIREHKQQRHREFIHRSVLSWGPLLQSYYSRLNEPLNETVIAELISRAQHEVEIELLGTSRQEREKLTLVQREERIQARLSAMTPADIELITDRVLSRSLAAAFYASGNETEVNEAAVRIEKRIHQTREAEKQEQDVPSQQRRRETVAQEVQALSPTDPERFVVDATEKMRPLRQRYVDELSFLAETSRAVAENVASPPETKIPDIDFMVLIAVDKAGPVRTLTEKETRRIITEAKEATVLATAIESDSSGFRPGSVFREAMAQSSSPATRALGNLFGLLSESKQEQIIQAHFERAWTTVVTKIAHSDPELTRQLGQSFVQSDLFVWLKNQGAQSFTGPTDRGGAISLFDNLLSPVFGSAAVATAAFGDAEQSVVSYLTYAKQNQPLFDRIKDKEGLESLKKLYADLQKERSVFLALGEIDINNPQSTLPVVATIHSLGTPHFPVHLPQGGIALGTPESGVLQIPVAAHARSAVFLRYLERYKPEIFNSYSLYILHIRQHFPAYFHQSGTFVFMQNTGRWALRFAGKQVAGRAGKALAGTALSGLAKFGISRAAITAIGGVATGGIGLVAGFLASAGMGAIKALLNPEGLLRRLRGEAPLRASDAPAIFIVVLLVLFVVFLKPPDFYNAELAARAPSGGGGESGPNDQAVPYDLSTEACDPARQECRWPAAGCIVQGPRTSGGTHNEGGVAENAIDIVAPSGTPLYATVNGTIEYMNDTCGDNTGYPGNKCGGGLGNFIRIRSDDGVLIVYAHMSRYEMKKSGRVHVGEIVGYMDQTGYSYQPHVHYEVESGHDINSILPFPVPACGADAVTTCGAALGGNQCVSP